MMNERPDSEGVTSAESLIQKEISPVYEGTELQSMLALQRRDDGEAVALFSDIDDSYYLPDEPEASKDLFNEAKEQNVPSIAVTGNQIQVVEERIARDDLPRFPVVCSSVGSQIWVLSPGETNGEGRYVLDEKYRERVLAVGFDRRAAVATAGSYVARMKESDPTKEIDFQWPVEEAEFLNGGPHLENQEFKVSLQFRSTIEEMQKIKQSFHELFPKFRVSVCQIGESGKNSLYFMDILAADKADAINYLTEELGVDYGMVAGDSGNDIAMLTASNNNIHSVLVGSNKPEALSAINAVTSQDGASGLGSFRKVPNADGSKLFYTERKGLRGPHSIKRAAKILQKAAAIARIRQTREDNQQRSAIGKKI